MGNESVRIEVRLGPAFVREAFERAYTYFHELYNVRPTRALCAPDVLERYCALYETSVAVAHRRSARVAFEGVPLVAAILPPGMVAFEGLVDEERMGDW